MESNAPFALVVIALSPAVVGLVVLCVQLWPRTMPRLVVIPWVRRGWAKGTRIFERAQIATILVPLVNEVLAGRQPVSGTILIVGSDGMYVAEKKKKRLQRAIRSWTNRGLHVRYLLVAPDDQALRELERLRAELSDRSRLEILPLKHRLKDAAPKTAALVEVLRTVHPTLIEVADTRRGRAKRAMWIEGQHLPNRMYATGNRWVAPDAMVDQADRPGVTWNDVFSQWDSRLKPLCDYAREEQTVQ